MKAQIIDRPEWVEMRGRSGAVSAEELEALDLIVKTSTNGHAVALPLEGSSVKNMRQKWMARFRTRKLDTTLTLRVMPYGEDGVALWTVPKEPETENTSVQ